MEGVHCELNGDKFDKAIHGGLDNLPTLPSGDDLAVYAKRAATVKGNAGAVITFTVELPDGRLARAQITTTAALMETIGRIFIGWREGGHL